MGWTFTITLMVLLFGLGAYRLLSGGQEDISGLVLKMVVSFFLISAMHIMGGLGAFSVMAVLPGVLLALIWAAPLGEMLGGGVSGLLTGSGQTVEERPFYSVAETRRMKSDYVGAIQAIGEQLRKFPGDFEGQKLLAEIQMENLRDFDSAQTTLQNIADQPHQKTGDVAYVLTMLADWQLKHLDDKEVARGTWESIVQRFPNTRIELMTAQRLARMDFFVGVETEEILLNEINTLPGFTPISMYPKLWEASGVSYRELIDRLIQLAMERHREGQQTSTDR